MSQLIVHIGPPKCGSSSIQEFFLEHKLVCTEHPIFYMMPPSLIDALNLEEPKTEATNQFEELIRGSLTKSDVLIVSHEALFICPLTVQNICGIAHKMVNEIIIIGYCRRQSDYIPSAYAQWLFRSKEREEETTTVLKANSITPSAFTGLERHLIACIYDDFHSARQLSGMSIINWYKSYNQIQSKTKDSGAVLKVSALSNLENGLTLIEDFCKKAKLTLLPAMLSLVHIRRNQGFHPDLVEALNVRLKNGYQVSGPHEDNDRLIELSQKISTSIFPKTPFINNLKNYIDSYFLKYNSEFCEKYRVPKEAFKVRQLMNKSFILSTITSEQIHRLKNPDIKIRKYNDLKISMFSIGIEL